MSSSWRILSSLTSSGVKFRMLRRIRRKLYAVLESSTGMGMGSISAWGQRELSRAPVGQTETQWPQDMQDISLMHTGPFSSISMIQLGQTLEQIPHFTHLF